MKEWGEIIKFPILKFFLFAVIQSLVQILWYFTEDQIQVHVGIQLINDIIVSRIIVKSCVRDESSSSWLEK